MSARTVVALAGILGALAVAAGAFGAHGLQGKIDAQAMAWYETAARYHLLHAVALLGVGALAAHGYRVRTAALALTVGVLVFSGTLYAMALGGPRWLGAVTPIGGVALIAGWVALAASQRTR
ncbi:MAG: DUF423 domain-containing protein [Planctomycetota bacterium]